MIIQGSNAPIVLTFSDSLEGIQDVHVSLYDQKNNEIKHWKKDEVEIGENTITCPLQQSETIAFLPGTLMLEAKWLDADGVTQFSDVARIVVKSRNDKHLLGEG